MTSNPSRKLRLWLFSLESLFSWRQRLGWCPNKDSKILKSNESIKEFPKFLNVQNILIFWIFFFRSDKGNQCTFCYLYIKATACSPGLSFSLTDCASSLSNCSSCFFLFSVSTTTRSNPKKTQSAWELCSSSTLEISTLISSSRMTALDGSFLWPGSLCPVFTSEPWTRRCRPGPEGLRVWGLAPVFILTLHEGCRVMLMLMMFL